MSAEQPLILVTETEPTETVYFAEGASLRLHCAISEAEGRVATDPDSVTLTVTPPYAAALSYTVGGANDIIKDATGVYYADVALTAPGKWKARWLAVLNSIDCGSSTTSFVVVAE